MDLSPVSDVVGNGVVLKGRLLPRGVKSFIVFCFAASSRCGDLAARVAFLQHLGRNYFRGIAKLVPDVQKNGGEYDLWGCYEWLHLSPVMKKDAIPPCPLGSVEGRIGPPDQLVRRFALPRRREADAHRQRCLFFGAELLRCKRFAKVLCSYGTIAQFSVAEYNHKLLTTIPAGQSAGGRAFFQFSGGTLEYLVSYQMAVRVIYLFKIIQIGQQQYNVAGFRSESSLEHTAIGQAGERVELRQEVIDAVGS